MTHYQYMIGNIKAGVGEHVPKVALSDAFIHRESRNVRRHLGKYERVRGRLPALYDADQNKIAAPKYIWSITGLSQGEGYFEVSGTYATEFAAENNAPFRINGSTDNDGLYTVASVTENGGTTRISVNEAIPDSTIDGNVFLGSTRVLEYHTHTKDSSGTEYLLLATAYHILLWSYSNRTLTIKFTCTTPTNVEAWSFASFQDNVYAVNGDDHVLIWDIHTSASLSFENLGGENGLEIADGVYCTSAKFVTAYEGYIMLGYTKEDGEWNPRRSRWPDADNPTQWNEDEAGDQGYHDLLDEEGQVNGFAKWRTYLEIAGTKRMVRAWIVTTDAVFNFQTELLGIGSLAPKAMVNDKFGRLYFLASDLTIRELDSAVSVFRPIEQTIKGLNEEVAWDARATYYEDIDRIFWAVPTGDSDTNDMLIEFDPQTQDFYFREIPVSAFGNYSRQETYTYNTLPYETYDAWGLAWLIYDSHVNSAGFLLSLCADYSGYSFEVEQSSKDNSEDFDGELVLGTSLGGKLHEYKRISQPITLVFDREDEGKIVTIYVKKDTEERWTQLGSVSLADNDVMAESVFVTIPCDLRFRHISFKISSSNHFGFLGLYIPHYETEGIR